VARGPAGSTQRRRLKAFLSAFIIRALTYVGGYAIFFQLQITGSDVWAVAPLLQLLDAWLFPIGILAFILKLGHGIRAGLIVDLDRKLPWGISKATVAAIFIAVFAGVQTLVSEFLSNNISLGAGALSAAGLVFFLAPMQRFAERVADRAAQAESNRTLSPTDQETFYREQVEIAYRDGVIGAKERQTLRSVQERLGLAADAALRIE
jgi:hypothetical protein